MNNLDKNVSKYKDEFLYKVSGAVAMGGEDEKAKRVLAIKLFRRLGDKMIVVGSFVKFIRLTGSFYCFKNVKVIRRVGITILNHAER